MSDLQVSIIKKEPTTNRQVSIYFYANGKPEEAPSKVSVTQQDIIDGKLVRVTKSDIFWYKEAVIYHTDGRRLKKIKYLKNNARFVLVPPNERFKDGPYEDLLAFYSADDGISIKKEKDDNLSGHTSQQQPSTSATADKESPILLQEKTKQFNSCPHHSKCPIVMSGKPTKKNRCSSCCHKDSSDEDDEVVKTTTQPTQTEPTTKMPDQATIQEITPYSRYDFECKHGTHAMKVYRFHDKEKKNKKKPKSGCCGKQPVSDSD